MLFNIKNWQDKHLITESRLKEIDFKDKAAFDKYQAKHKMRSTTKVNVAGKDTTAGEASGGKKAASKAGSAKHTSAKFKKVAIPVMNDMLDDAIENYDGNFDDWMENGMSVPPASVESGLEELHGMSSEEEVDKFMEKASSRIKDYLDAEGYNDRAEEKPKKSSDSGEKKASGKSAHASKLTPQQRKSIVSDTVKKLAFAGQIDPSVAKLSQIYLSGMSIEDAKAELQTQINYDPDGKGVSKYKQKKTEKEVHRLLDNMYTGMYDGYINAPNIRSNRKDDWIVDPELDKRVKKNGEKLDAEKAEKDGVEWKEYEEKRAAEKAEKEKNRTPKEIEKAKTQFKFSESDYESPKEYRDNVKVELQKTYDLDEVEPDRMQQMIDGADEYFYDEARSAGKAGRRSKPTSAKNFASYIEQYFDEDGIEPKNESITSRSTRIQEAKIYRTIQELKGLERGL